MLDAMRASSYAARPHRHEWGPRRVSARPPGTGSVNSRRARNPTRPAWVSSSLEPPPEPPTKEEPMSKKHLTDQHVIQRAVVLQLLRDDRPHRWTRKKLKREISDVKGRAIDKALEYLGSEDVVHLEDKEG